MTASPQLFELIKSLTPSEKRHFRLYAAKHVIGEKNNYMKLFEVIAKQETYNEEKVKKTLAKEKFVHHLPYEKNYLYEMISDSLLVFHMNANAESRLRKHLQHVGVLFEKGLYAHCDKILRKIESTAMTLEKYQYAYEALLWQKKLMGQRSYSGIKQHKLKEIFDRTVSVLDKMKNNAEYSNLSEMLRYLIDTSGQVRSRQQKKKFDLVVRHPLLKTEKRALTDSGKRMYNSIKMNYNYYTNGKLRNIIRYTTRELELLESHPLQVQENPNSYIGVLGNIIITYLEEKNYGEAMRFLNKLRTIPEKFNIRLRTNLQVKIFVLLYSQELTLYIETGAFEKIYDVVGEVESGLTEFEGKIGKTYAITIYYNMAYLYIGANEPRKALHWLNKILVYADADAREDIICFSKILQLIVYFEMNDTDLLPYAFRSTYHYLSKRKKVYLGETMLLDFIRTVPRLDTRLELKNAYSALRDKLKKLERMPFENNLFVYFDFISWLESKIEGKTFALVVKEKKENTEK